MARYMGDHSSLPDFACFYVLDIVLFYFNAHIILTNFLPNKLAREYITLGLSILSEIAVYVYLSVVLNNAFNSETGISLFLNVTSDVLASAVWRSLYFIGLSIAYWSVLRTIQAIRTTTAARISELDALNRSQRLEKDILILKNTYLQARINPHFLFNTLNFIYDQAEEGDPDIGGNIALLSEIMQYALSAEENDGKVPLYKEVDHIKRYIRLNMSRFDHKLFLNEKIDNISDRTARIPPLILLTFVENVFKHGDMTDRDTPGIIVISYRERVIDLLTKNKKRKTRKDMREHVGIQNALTRLKNFYPGKSIHYSIKEEVENYTFTLKLSL
jgi:sensor histidine kinase YesM